MSRFTDTLNAQVGNEFGASQQYVAIAVWYDAETLPQLADVLLPPGGGGAEPRHDARPVPARRR